MCCTRFAENTGRNNVAKNRHLGTITQLCPAIIIFATKARIDNRKKVVKQQYVLQVSSQYGELWPITAEIGSGVWAPQLISTGFASWQRYCAALQ